MVKKKHCDKHYRFVASCPECQTLNSESEENSDQKRLYDDVNIDDFNYNDFSNSKNENPTRRPEIPNIENNTTYQNEAPKSNRFTYTRLNSPNFKKKLYIVGIIAVIIILVIIFYIYPVWHAKINLQNQLYETKSGLDFWEIYTLNGWSTNFFFNYIGLIGGILGALIMCIPPDDSLITIIGQKLGWGRPSKVKTLLIWLPLGFVLFFIIGQAMGGGYFDLVMKMISEGKIDGKVGSFLNALNAITNPEAVSQVDIFLYSAVTAPIIRFVLGIIIFRLISSIVYYAYLVKDEFQIAARASFMIAIFFIMSLLDRPLQAQNGIDLIQVWSIYLGIFCFFGLGIAFLVYGRKQNQHKVHQFSRNIQKKTIVAAVLTIFIILIPVFISIPKNIGLSTPETWTNEVWDVKEEKQIDWTRAAAGITIGDINMFTTYSIDKYPQNVIESDSTILDVIRQHDKENSAKQIRPLITNSFQTMADSDIVFVQGKGEFWVAPKTLQAKKLLETPVNQHTEIYDHVEGFIALDTSTGKILQDSQDYQEIFGVSSDYPIFFGEKEDTTSYTSDQTSDLDFYSPSLSIDAYDNDILLYTGWKSNESMQYEYDGEPDGTISGLEALWFTANMGLTKNAFDGEEKSYLINRNIRKRVESILLPGLQIDDDPYLVFDRNNSKMYYAVSIYTEIDMDAYTDSFLYRFLGTVLVDVQTGVLSWYRNPGLPMSSEDPLSSIWGVFMSVYPWKIADDWLLEQLRYPETLWEKQLVVDYKYHVTNKDIWKLETDFFKRPKTGDVFYIETDLGEGLEFVGVDIVEYDQVDSVKLAGFYIIRQGNHFGETIFYKTQSSNNIIGPSTASGELGNQAKSVLSLITPQREGNVLLYPLASSLYYYIPVYSQDGDLESLALAGLVNAFTKETYYGSTLTEAYNELKIDQKLNDTTETNTTDLLFEVREYDEFQYSPTNWAEIQTYFEYVSTNDSLPPKNLMLNLSIRTDVGMDVKVFNDVKTGYQYNFTENLPAWNFTLGVWNSTDALNPGQAHLITMKLKPSNDLIGASISMFIKFDLIDLDSGEIISNGWNILTFVNPV